ncbi:hypothetical protein R5R35_002832 [Gryllus longicercus]|uniref:Uncharacterized protein n=1 Tax=Gryllus longicercus TaxID=2509291 RepID=A0AAN9VMU1_9ORTH
MRALGWLRNHRRASGAKKAGKGRGLGERRGREEGKGRLARRDISWLRRTPAAHHIIHPQHHEGLDLGSSSAL